MVMTGAVGVAGAAYITFRDPTTRSVFAPCPLHAATGIWCPGCGLTRGMYSLFTGDFVAAVGYNLFAPAIAVAIIYWWVANTSFAFTGRRPRSFVSGTPRTLAVVGAVALVFTVLRNLSSTPFGVLAP